MSRSRVHSQAVDRGGTNPAPSAQQATTSMLTPCPCELVLVLQQLLLRAVEASHSQPQLCLDRPIRVSDTQGSEPGQRQEILVEMWSQEGSLVARVCGIYTLRQQKFCKDQCQLDCWSLGFYSRSEAWLVLAEFLVPDF